MNPVVQTFGKLPYWVKHIWGDINMDNGTK